MYFRIYCLPPSVVIGISVFLLHKTNAGNQAPQEKTNGTIRMSSGSSPKMKDVADRCGVSESTVSHALNGTKKVAAKTREKIEKAIADLNYHRDSDARRLARGKSNFLGLIISDIENPFYPGLIKAFEAAAIKAGYEMLLCTTNYDPKQTESAFRKMIENKSPGVAVMTSRVDPKMAHRLAEQGIATGCMMHLLRKNAINSKRR